MLRAEELMVGDWVQNPHGLKGRVRSIKYIPKENADNYGGYFLLELVFSESAQTFPINDARPIPITPEILEKNGFKKKNIFAETLGYEIFGDEENSCGLSGWYDGSWEFDMFTPWTETADDGSPEDWGFGTETRITRIKYVHELQHCLKLCGIDKTIEL